jgi:hypothetical protein
MAAGLADRFENEGAQLLGEPLQPPAVELAQRRRIVDGLQQLVRARIVFGRPGSRPFAGQIRLSDSAHEGNYPSIRRRPFTGAHSFRTCAGR